jgi:hypothetical protein
LILILTKKFPHPTSAFRLNVLVNEQRYEIAGYAFRQQKSPNGIVYEPILINYPHDNAIELSVPPSEVHDQLLFLGRLSIDPKENFPDSPEQILKFQITPETKTT